MSQRAISSPAMIGIDSVKTDRIQRSQEGAAREMWARRRSVMEESGLRFTPVGVRAIDGDRWFERALQVFGWGLRSSGLFWLGKSIAKNVRLTEIDLSLENLPPAFDGYRILHLTDLHIDKFPGLDKAITKAVKGLNADLCVMTGDFRAADDGPHAQIIAPMKRLVNAIEPRDGIFAVLGNHDDHHLGLALEEKLGIRLLANETKAIVRGGDRLVLTGADDVNRFYTADADKVFSRRPSGFGVALVHSPEMADQAARAGYSLYLCGHTHGGQICLPGGKPLVTHLNRNRDLASGLWKVGDMRGYTSSGAGVSGPPVRFFSRSEVTLFRLKRKGV